MLRILAGQARSAYAVRLALSRQRRAPADRGLLLGTESLRRGGPEIPRHQVRRSLRVRVRHWVQGSPLPRERGEEPIQFAALVFRAACGVNVTSSRGGASSGTTAKCATGRMFKVTVVPDELLETLQSLKIDLSNTR